MKNNELQEKTIGQRLKAERQRLGLSQESIALMCGLDRKSQYSYESTITYPSADYLQKCDRIGMDIYYVITGKRPSHGGAMMSPDTAHPTLIKAEGFGLRLQQERRRLGLKCSDMAQICRMSVQAQRDYEADRRRPKADYWQAAQAAGLDVTFIRTGDRHE